MLSDLCSQVMLENVPQLVLQWYFMFQLELFTNVVIASFISSILNILMALMTTATFWILHRDQVDVPFSIALKWKPRVAVGILESNSTSKKDADPFAHCGKRKKLAKLLGKIRVNGDNMLKFEVMSTTEQSSGSQSACQLFGVHVSERNALSNTDLFSEFLEKQMEIEEAVMSAFRLDDLLKDYDFQISMTRTSKLSDSDRLKSAVDALRYFNVSKPLVSAVQKEMKKDLAEKKAAENEAVDDVQEPEGGGLGTSGGTVVK